MRCRVPKCKSTKHLHCVPFANRTRWEAWLNNCPFFSNYTLKQLENVRICELHFLPQYITNHKLSKDAIPTLELQNKTLFWKAVNNESMGEQTRSEQSQSPKSSEPQSVNMLIFLQNGEEKLVSFTLPEENCTLQDVLEQCNIPFMEDTYIQCLQNSNGEIDYFVSVGVTTLIEEVLENHPMAVGVKSRRSIPKI